MPLLDAKGVFIADTYSREAGSQKEIVPFAALSETLAARKPGSTLGVDVPNTADIEALKPHFVALSLIGIAFPAYSDGRGFTLAKRLRREGFTGTLRLVGPVIADQFAYALACGFDEVELPEASAARQPAEHWVKAAAAFSATYQRGYVREANILDQRRAARLEGRNG